MSSTEPTCLGLANSGAVINSFDLRQRELLSHLDQVASEFSDEARHRGISRSWHDYRYLIRQLSKLLNSGSLASADYLDLGSGAGVIPLVMARAGFTVTAVDTWNEYAQELHNQMGSSEEFFARFGKYSVRWIRHDLLRPPLPLPSRSFDLITLFNVVEHLPRPAEVLQEVERLLRPNGLLVISLPNVANLRNRLRLLIGRTPHADDIEKWFSPSFSGHYREMTKDEVKKVLSRFGFSILVARYSDAWHWNTRLPNDRWESKYRLSSARQWIKLCYLLLTSLVPSFRYQLLVAARK